MGPGGRTDFADDGALGRALAAARPDASAIGGVDHALAANHAPAGSKTAVDDSHVPLSGQYLHRPADSGWTGDRARRNGASRRRVRYRYHHLRQPGLRQAAVQTGRKRRQAAVERRSPDGAPVRRLLCTAGKTKGPCGNLGNTRPRRPADLPQPAWQAYTQDPQSVSIRVEDMHSIRQIIGEKGKEVWSVGP